DQSVPADTHGIEKVKKERNQPWVAIHEYVPVLSVVGLVLGALTPIGNGASDEEFPLGQRADLGGRGGAGGLPLRLAGGAFGLPVAAHPLGGPLAALLVAQTIGPGHVPDPERD